MHFLSRVKISGKILLAFGLFAPLCAGIVGLATYNTLTLGDVTQHIVDHEAAAVRLAASAQEHATRIHQIAYEIIESDSNDWGELQGTFDEEAKGAKEDLKALRSLAAAKEAGAMDDAAHALDAYIAVASQLGTLLQTGRRDDAKNLLKTTGNPIFGRSDSSFDQIVATETKDLTSAAYDAGEKAQIALWLMIGTSMLGLLGVAAVALTVVRRQVVIPLAAVTAAMNKLAEGDLDAGMTVSDRHDEIGNLSRAFATFRQAAIEKIVAETTAAKQRELFEEERRKALQAETASAKAQSEVVQCLATGLAKLASGDLFYRVAQAFPTSYQKLRDDFNDAIDKLQQAMKSVKSSAMEIRAGSDEISQSAEELSRRTEQQAASLEETAAALNEITSTVRRTAEGATEANNVVLAAKVDAERSGNVVRDAVKAMSEIEKSAQQISQIIGVIDEIAFQTNLLALNAGVEAARAGDAGKGFAVVATEVRALAQRSAAAAKEIKTLISTSTHQVSTGVQLVGQTGQALARIMTSIAEINKLVAEIAESAKEQAAGLHEINSAIEQMDHVTQQNASMVEESTAASFALASETQQLTDLIARFKIDDAPGEGAKVPERATQVAPVARKSPAVRAAVRGGAATVRKAELMPSQEWEDF